MLWQGLKIRLGYVPGMNFFNIHLEKTWPSVPIHFPLSSVVFELGTYMMTKDLGV